MIPVRWQSSQVATAYPRWPTNMRPSSPPSPAAQANFCLRHTSFASSVSPVLAHRMLWIVLEKLEIVRKRHPVHKLGEGGHREV